MLSNQLQDGMETAKLMWSPLPDSEAAANGSVADELDRSKKTGGSFVESLDYEVMENHAYRQEQVVYFPHVVKVEDVLSILRSNNHNGFPVIDHARSRETLVVTAESHTGSSAVETGFST